MRFAAIFLILIILVSLIDVSEGWRGGFRGGWGRRGGFRRFGGWGRFGGRRWGGWGRRWGGGWGGGFGRPFGWGYRPFGGGFGMARMGLLGMRMGMMSMYPGYGYGMYGKCIVNIISVTIHIWVLLIILLTPKLRQPTFDELFFSQNMADILSVFVRVSATYLPTLLVDYEDERITNYTTTRDDLANWINAAEWYNSWTIVISGLLLACDRAVLALSMKTYHWTCNRFFKWMLVMITWVIPLSAVMPMFTECCGSYFIDGHIELLDYKDHNVGAIYDSIDMIFETIVYAPTLCALNTFTLVMMWKQYKRVLRRSADHLQKKVPSIVTIEHLCIKSTANRVTNGHFHRQRREEKHSATLERLEIELTFAMVSILDQQIDFIVILSYTLYWASEMNFAPVQQDLALNAYYIAFEVGNLIMPYVYLIACAPLREAFFSSFYRMLWCREKKK
ncbi:unnamed protein product, partial [Mesorhabditis belari]|uniref:G-protein coupled receptors family 1 profile domain-containing protein n=1 Tax=Mesorhabditis belari TaxID=2138241 RepID=A0AAF3FR91_9BILA